MQLSVCEHFQSCAIVVKIKPANKIFVLSINTNNTHSFKKENYKDSIS